MGKGGEDKVTQRFYAILVYIASENIREAKQQGEHSTNNQ